MKKERTKYYGELEKALPPTFTREQLEEDTAAFLKSGGVIQQCKRGQSALKELKKVHIVLHKRL